MNTSDKSLTKARGRNSIEKSNPPDRSSVAPKVPEVLALLGAMNDEDVRTILQTIQNRLGSTVSPGREMAAKGSAQTGSAAAAASVKDAVAAVSPGSKPASNLDAARAGLKIQSGDGTAQTHTASGKEAAKLQAVLRKPAGEGKKKTIKRRLQLIRRRRLSENEEEQAISDETIARLTRRLQGISAVDDVPPGIVSSSSSASTETVETKNEKLTKSYADAVASKEATPPP